MTLLKSMDHSDFIARYHKRAAPLPKKGTPYHVYLSLVLFFIIPFYFIGLFAYAQLMHIPNTHLTPYIVGFPMGLIILGFIYRIARYQNVQMREKNLLSMVIEGSRAARFVVDSQDKILLSNEKFRMLCAPSGEPSLESLTKLFSKNEEILSHFRLLADQAWRGLTDSIELFSEYEQVKSWYRITAQPIPNWPNAIHWRIDDITDRRGIDKAIREEREKLIDFTDNAPVGFFSVDEEGRFLFINATFARWLGEDIETLMREGRLHACLENPPEKAKPYDLITDGGTKQIVELKMKGHGGRPFLAMINQTVVRESDGKVRTRAVVNDVTSEHAMKQALAASEDRFQRFFEEAPLGIMLMSHDGGIETCNAAFLNMLRCDYDQIHNMPFRQLVLDRDRHTIMQALDAIGQGQQMNAPAEITLSYGDHNITVQMHGRRFRESNTLVLHFIDLTQQKTLEAQFVQSQKMQAIGQLAGGVAHDFNNLLTAMIGFCDLLLMRHKPGDPSFSDIMQIKQNSNRAANLVRQLLAFSRQQTLQPKVQDITDILTELTHLLRRLLGAKIDMNVLHGENLGLVKVDGGQMEQVLINLAVNARDAMNNEGELTIETRMFENKAPLLQGEDTMPPARWVQIHVQDTGCGIPDEILGRIFEPFFTTKDVGQGTGLGLATVYGIIRQTGGFLHVESKKGEGARFIISLPVASEKEEKQILVKEEDNSNVSADLTGSARILLVEDEDAVRAFSSRALSNKGYDVIEANSGEDALEKFESMGLSMNRGADRGIDLVITDVVMPNMDGPTLVSHIRKAAPDLKIIFMSGYTEDKLKDHMDTGIHFLAKPFTLKQLAEKVKDVMKG